MKSVQVEDVKKVIRMMDERAEFWADRYNDKSNYVDERTTGMDYGAFVAYETCAYFMRLLLNNDWEALNQYDYFGEN